MPRRVLSCPELSRQLRQSRPLQRFFASLEDYQRQWIVEWIHSARRDDTRRRRAVRAAELLMKVMDAESDLPPVLKIAFARSPKAGREWERWTLDHRRATLLRLFERPGRVSFAKAVPALIKELEFSAGRQLDNTPDE